MYWDATIFAILILDSKYFFMFRFGDPKCSAASTEFFEDWFSHYKSDALSFISLSDIHVITYRDLDSKWACKQL